MQSNGRHSLKGSAIFDGGRLDMLAKFSENKSWREYCTYMYIRVVVNYS